MPLLRFPRRDLLLAWFNATVFSGLPSTAWALATGGDALEATRAAGAMLVAPDAPWTLLLPAAGVAHGAVSTFWALAFGALLPRRGVVAVSLAGIAAVALLDLRLIAPRFFPEVAALAFWPQFADHLAWGALLGGTLAWRLRTQRARAAP